jgi:thiol-disulfide isomerase/thioredoxin
MKTRSSVYTFFAITAAILLLNSCSGDSTKAIRTGDTISSFTGTDLEGRTFSLASHKGKPVIVRFFLLNCPYCKADTPIFNEFYDKYRQKGLEM